MINFDALERRYGHEQGPWLPISEFNAIGHHGLLKLPNGSIDAIDYNNKTFRWNVYQSNDVCSVSFMDGIRGYLKDRGYTQCSRSFIEDGI